MKNIIDVIATEKSELPKPQIRKFRPISPIKEEVNFDALVDEDEVPAIELKINFVKPPPKIKSPR